LSLLDGGTPGEGPFVSEGSANQLRTFNETHQSFSTTSTIAEAFEAAVERHPQRVAVTGGGVEYTYAQLNSRANALAARLRHLGVQPDALVAVHLERSVDIVTALLGIHKAGGAYVPVDPSYPEARKRLMIEDSRASIVVTSAALAREVSAAGLRILILEQESAAPAAPNLQSLATGDSLAYVIYTSGSTGRPKGVMVEHRNVLNFFAGMDERIGTDPGVWLAVTSISFDISVLELLWTVTRGFTVVIDAAKPTVAPARPSFSLFFFSSEGGTGQGAYDLVLRASKFADERGFEAVWTPERPPIRSAAFLNPFLMSVMIASCTAVQTRSGSRVLPLHSQPARPRSGRLSITSRTGASESRCRAGSRTTSSFGPRAGQAPTMEREIPVQALWRGESQAFLARKGEAQVRTLPRPAELLT
jgi:hypothetical protein